MVIKAVFFDIGGTLVMSTTIIKNDSPMINKKIIKELVGPEYDFTLEEIEEARKKTDKMMIEKYGNPHKPGAIFAKEFYKMLGIDVDDETARKADKMFWTTLFGRAGLVENVKEVFSYLKGRGIKIIIITNNKKSIASDVMDQFGLMDKIDDLITSEEYGLKSTTIPFKVAMDRFGLEPEEVLMVGNSIYEDVLGAQKAGVRAILVDHRGNLDNFYESYAELDGDNVKPDFVIKNLIDIKEILERLNNWTN